jgi:hypothetical protein
MAQNYKGPLDYIDVATRIVEFREKYPTGSLQQVKYEFVQVAGKDWIIYTAAAFRTPEDIRPGIGTAWEPIPGPTNFTRDSEVQNAETAAWGRAIVAVLAADTRKGIASSEEVRNRQEKTSDVGLSRVPAPKNFKPIAKAERVYTEAEISYAQSILAEIAATADLSTLRQLWTREKDFHECKANGTTVLDAINVRVAQIEKETVSE